MAANFSKGQKVQRVSPSIIGEVVTLAIVGDELQYLVKYPTADGELHQRYFTEAQLQSVPEPAPT